LHIKFFLSSIFHFWSSLHNSFRFFYAIKLCVVFFPSYYYFLSSNTWYVYKIILFFFKYLLHIPSLGNTFYFFPFPFPSFLFSLSLSKKLILTRGVWREGFHTNSLWSIARFHCMIIWHSCISTLSHCWNFEFYINGKKNCILRLSAKIGCSSCVLACTLLPFILLISESHMVLISDHGKCEFLLAFLSWVILETTIVK
jgi:hypothetical protein